MVVVGQSNARALRDGFELLATGDPGAVADADVTMIMKRKDDLFVHTWRDGAFERTTSTGPVATAIAQLQPTHVVLMWGGNQMNLRSLLADGPPFDVILPTTVGEPEVVEGARIIPCAAVRRYVGDQLAAAGDLEPAIAAASDAGAATLFLGPPPPIPADAVRQRLGDSPHFVGIMKQFGISPGDAPIVPDAVRQRLWRLLTDTYEGYALDHGMTFLGPPEESFDDRGMLDAPFWGADATHGNADYGSRYMTRVLRWSTAGCA
jgi:hypothetical protein